MADYAAFVAGVGRYSVADIHCQVRLFVEGEGADRAVLIMINLETLYLAICCLTPKIIPLQPLLRLVSIPEMLEGPLVIPDELEGGRLSLQAISIPSVPLTLYLPLKLVISTISIWVEEPDFDSFGRALYLYIIPTLPVSNNVITEETRRTIPRGIIKIRLNPVPIQCILRLR